MQNDNKLVVRWSLDAIAVLDPAVVEHVNWLIESFLAAKTAGLPFPEVLCAQETIVNELRLRIRRGELPPDSVVFIFEDQELHPNYAGRLPTFPHGFCDLMSNQLAGLIRPLPKA